jgi:diguanylate cyclase (GGDEF)-like protein
MAWAVLAVLGALTAWVASYQLADTLISPWAGWFPFSGVGTDIPFEIAGVLLVFRGISRPGERGWVLIGVGALCWGAGDVYWNVKLLHMTSPPVPSWADAGYLSFCPLTFAGIFLLMRDRLRNVSVTLIADAAAAALAVGALSAAVVVQPVLASSTGGVLSVATNLAYPLWDLLLLSLIVGVIAVSGWKLDRLWVLLGAAVVSFWVADSAYLITVATNTYHDYSWFNPLWYLSPILAAWAAWLPTRRSPEPGAAAPVGRRGIVMPLLFAVMALGLLVRSSFSSVGVIAIVLATLSLLVIMIRLALTWRENAQLLRTSREEALTDSLTGLGNRRALTVELERRLSRTPVEPFVLALFDLDGFKHYNDSFGHPAGDALLIRLARDLTDCLGDAGGAYRMGGDEFCVLVDCEAGFELAVETAASALSARGEGFAISCSHGSVRLPLEADEVASALRKADQRMYARKQSGRMSVSHQSGNVLLRALAERDPDLSSHLHDVAELAVATARALSLPEDEVAQVRQAAELHDVGKMAIPDALLNKPGPLSEEEWAFIRRHTLIGERILAAAPALKRVAAIVRASHESFDGTGYPDRLSGAAIPLGARIIAVCDAYHAMTSDRPYRAARDERGAVQELRTCSGTQFDPLVVDAFCQVLSRRGLTAVA